MNVAEFLVCAHSPKAFWGATIGLCGGFLLGVEKHRHHRLPLVVRAVDTGDSELNALNPF